jgi:CRISPR/Cas system-associated endoribonuclease Cas2
MPIYIVAYDIGKTTDREELEVEIRKNFNDSCQINKSVWLLETIIDTPGIKARLLQLMADEDCLIISRLTAQVAVQALADDGSTWLDSKGIRVL